MCEAEGVERGTKIVIHLRENADNYAKRRTVEAILKKYSNFVGYPIYLNGVRVNTIQAIWNLSRNEVTEEQHAEFYRFVANAYDAPTYRIHFNADVPIQVNALFYFPERHMEKYGMGRMDPGTSLYSRKVLIKSKCTGLLPDYFRFVQGVVDSEDVPLNISRENMQDSLLISRISSVLTKRIIKHLQEEARKDADKYKKWYGEFGSFLKEGVCSDFTHKNELARLLRFDSSNSEDGVGFESLDDYISRMPPTQQNIYYLCAPNRRTAMASPYYESLKSSGAEVLFLYHPLDDFVMKNLREYSRRKIVSAEASSDDAAPNADKKAEMEAEHAALVAFVKETLGSKVSTLTLTDKISTFPAFVMDHESATMRKMMKMMDTQGLLGDELPVSKQKLSINPKHPIFVKLMGVKDAQPDLAKLIVEQVFDNALMAADILDNPRNMLPRMHKLLESALDSVPASVKASPAGPQ
jgi:HSP90 family molecular chaperone